MADKNHGAAENPTWLRIAVIVASGALIVSIGGFALSTSHKLSALAILVGLLLATVLGGAVLGLLFGIPRYVERPDAAPTTSNQAAPASSYQPNTNLEQISDWLTKILIGIGIAEARTLATAVDDFLNDSLVPALDSADGAYIIGLTTMAAGVILGFLLGWLTTRLTLGHYLKRSDDELFNEAADALRDVDPALAEELRDVAAQTATQAPDATATQAPSEYENAVLEVLRDKASDLGLSSLVEGRKASPWDARFEVGSTRWGLEVKWTQGPLRVGVVRMQAGRLSSGRFSVDSTLIVSNEAGSSTAMRELMAFDDTELKLVLVVWTPDDGPDEFVRKARDALVA